MLYIGNLRLIKFHQEESDIILYLTSFEVAREAIFFFLNHPIEMFIFLENITPKFYLLKSWEFSGYVFAAPPPPQEVHGTKLKKVIRIWCL